MENSRIPNSLKKYRRLAGYSQRQVAKLLGLYDSNCISRWERGLCYPALQYLFKLSFLYKTLPNHLYHELYQHWKQECISLEKKLFADREPSNEKLLL